MTGGKTAVISEEFNRLAAEYETNRLSSWYKAHGEEILELCNSLKHKKVLDVGCGTAFLLRKLCKSYPEIKAIGMDLSSEMMLVAERKAKAENIENIQFIHADWETLDNKGFSELKTEGIDLIICANAFHYFEEPRLATQKFYDLLENGGKLIILDRDKSNSPLTFLWGFLHKYLIKDEVRFYTQSDLIDFLKQAGFGSVTIAQSIRRYFWKGKLFTSIALLNCQK